MLTNQKRLRLANRNQYGLLVDEEGLRLPDCVTSALVCLAEIERQSGDACDVVLRNFILLLILLLKEKYWKFEFYLGSDRCDGSAVRKDGPREANWLGRCIVVVGRHDEPRLLLRPRLRQHVRQRDGDGDRRRRRAAGQRRRQVLFGRKRLRSASQAARNGDSSAVLALFTSKTLLSIFH